MKRHIVAMAAVLAIGCSADQLPAPKMNATTSTIDSTKIKPEKLDPMGAKARLGSAGLVPASQGSTLQVPGFTLTLADADYAEVVRCARSYTPTAYSGVDARQIPATDPTRWEQMRSAFEEAKSDTNFCRIVGNHVIKPQVQDVAAPTGEFYYIVNPCVERERSSHSERVCSYELGFSDPVPYTSTASANFISAASDLAIAEGTLSATLSRLYRHAENMQRYKESCDTNFFASIAKRRTQQALISILTTGLSAGAGALLGTTGGQIASTFLGALRDSFNAFPEPQWSCPQFEVEQKSGAQAYGLLEGQLKAVVDTRAKLNGINSEYAKLDASIMENVRSNEGQ